jgi:hypothetical protein
MATTTAKTFKAVRGRAMSAPLQLCSLAEPLAP